MVAGIPKRSILRPMRGTRRRLLNVTNRDCVTNQKTLQQASKRTLWSLIEGVLVHAINRIEKFTMICYGACAL